MSDESQAIPALIGLAGVFLGALLGFAISRASKKLDDEQTARGYLYALQLDSIEAERVMKSYLAGTATAPAGRCPVSTWQTCRAFLASSGHVTLEDLITINLFFTWAEQMNYCIDRVTESAGLQRAAEIERAKIKAGHVVEQNSEGRSLAKEVREGLNRSIRRLNRS